MRSVHDIATEILSREGGYVNDPDDPGGATNHGVTLRTLRRLGIDKDGDGQSTAEDVRRLTPEDAVSIFETEYFQRPHIGDLPEAIAPSVFDMYVNAGTNAVRILQKLLCDMGFPTEIDGRIGPRTAAAAAEAQAAAPEHLADAYGIARRNYYYALGDARPASRKFARRRDGGKGGWITRAEEFIVPRFHLTEEQHHKRVAAWA